MEILAALKAGEVVVTEAGREAARAGLRWNNWSKQNAITGGYLEETDLAHENAAAREAEFRRLVGV